jgi:3-isopropylmalate/(R)-2-methylmalate dehydratase large subunit
MAGKTLYDKLWEMHEVTRRDDGSSLIYIDRHLLHEVTSAAGLRGPAPRRAQAVAPVDANLAVPPTTTCPPTQTEREGRADAASKDPVSRLQVETLDQNCDRFGIREFQMDDRARASCT